MQTSIPCVNASRTPSFPLQESVFGVEGRVGKRDYSIRKISHYIKIIFLLLEHELERVYDH